MPLNDEVMPYGAACRHLLESSSTEVRTLAGAIMDANMGLRANRKRLRKHTTSVSELTTRLERSESIMRHLESEIDRLRAALIKLAYEPTFCEPRSHESEVGAVSPESRLMRST
jgi:hypothetical protein